MNPAKVINNPEKQRYELIADGAIAGYAEYKLMEDAILFTHTEVADEHEGKGYGSELARHALTDASAQNRKVVPACRFIAAYIQRHPEYAGLVRPDR